MPAPQYTCETEGAVALASAAAKTVLGVKAHANSGLLLLGYWASMDGTTPSNAPVLVELMYSTWATQSPGTASTSTTPQQMNGRAMAAGFTSGKNWTTEPTALTACAPEIYLSTYQPTLAYNFPLGQELDAALAQGFVMRVTTVAGSGTPNFRGGLIVSRA